VVLCLPDCQSCHISVEADPLVFRVCILDLARLEECRRKVNLEDIVGPMVQRTGDIDPVWDPHIVAVEYDLAIELDMGEGVESIECQDGLSARLGLRHGWNFRSIRP